MNTLPTYLIIAGTTKSATSSVFFYLSKHPEVNPSFYKETRFFLDDTYPLYRPHAYSNQLTDYLKLFTNKQGSLVNLEATPDYLYSTETPQKIHNMLGEQARIVFILRNPTERVISWYMYAKQLGEIGDISFKEFLKIQHEDDTGKQHERVQVQGNYSNYLNNWFTYFTPKQVKIIFLNELQNNEKEVLKSVARFVGIDPSYYDSYHFEKINETKEVNLNLGHTLFTFYRKQKKNIRKFTYDLKIHTILSKLNTWVEFLYFKLNKKSNHEQIGKEEHQFLEKYYKDEKLKLEILLKQSIKW